MEANGQFNVPVTTTNYNVAFIEIKKSPNVEPPETLNGNYRIQSVESGKYLTLQSDTVSGATDDFVVLTTVKKGLARVIIGYKRVKALSVMERSMTKCQEKNEMKKDGTTKAAF